jgi:hypothetical protein
MLLLLQIYVLKDGLVIRCQRIEGGRRRSEGKKSVRRRKDLLVLNRGVVLLVLGGEQHEYSLRSLLMRLLGGGESAEYCLDGSWGHSSEKKKEGWRRKKEDRN